VPRATSAFAPGGTEVDGGIEVGVLQARDVAGVAAFFATVLSDGERLP